MIDLSVIDDYEQRSFAVTSFESYGDSD